MVYFEYHRDNEIINTLLSPFCLLIADAFPSESLASLLKPLQAKLVSKPSVRLEVDPYAKVFIKKPNFRHVSQSE